MKNVGWFIIASALVWGAVLIGCSLVLKDTPYKESVLQIVYGGAAVHLIIIWGGLVGMLKKKNEQK